MPQRQSKPFKGWAVVYPDGEIAANMVRVSPVAAVSAFMMRAATDDSWDTWLSHGYRVARVEVREIVKPEQSVGGTVRVRAAVAECDGEIVVYGSNQLTDEQMKDEAINIVGGSVLAMLDADVPCRKIPNVTANVEQQSDD